MDRVDLAIVGGGLSGSLTLLHLGRELERRGAARPRRIALLDRAGDFGTGVPYGRLAHPSRLLNETGATMEMHGFGEWLVRRRERWRDALRSPGGPAVDSWLARNARALERGRDDPAAFASTYLPRRVFGLFLEDVFEETLAGAARRGSPLVERRTDEVLGVRRAEDGDLLLEGRDGALRAGGVVLGLGSLPPEPEPDVAGRPAYAPDPSGRRVEELREALLESLGRGRAGSRRLALLGANASGLEMLHLVAHEPGVADAVDEIRVVSPAGRLPDARPSGKSPPFEATSLRELLERGVRTAGELAEAARADQERGRAAGYTSLDRLGPLGAALGSALRTLPPEERRRFAAEHGMRFTAANTHTPPEYADAAASLAASGRLAHLRGRVERVEWKGRPVVRYRGPDGNTARLIADFVADCRGAGRVGRSPRPLLRSLLEPGRGLATESAGGRGILVDDDFAAAPGVWVMGPLLAGHAGATDTIWHLESAPRIDPLAARLAATIAESWESSPER
jgi:uncharacterized NAD(P)/FAD-binding protein YdhS